MKKKLNILVLASAFAMLGATACSPTNNPTSSDSEATSSKTEDTSSSSTDICAITDEVRSIAEKAYNGVITSYGSWASSGVTGDQKLTTSAKKNNTDGTKEYEFTFAYSIAEAYASNLSVSEDGTSLIVVLPNSIKGEEDFQGKVHIKVYLKGCNDIAYENDVNILVKATALYDLEYIYSLDENGELAVKNGDAVTFNAIYMGIYPQQGAIFGDGEYAMLAYKYTTVDSFTVGDAVSVSGTIKDYSGLRELTDTTVTKLTSRPAGLVDPVTIDFDSTTARSLKWGDDNRKITVKGAKVTSVSTSDSGNTTIYTTLNGISYPVFLNATYSADVIPSWKRVRSGATEATLVEAGDIVTFTGYVSAYNSAYQVVYGEATEWEQSQISVNAPSQLFVGQSDKITVTLGDDVTPTSTTFVSSDPTVISVGEDGTINALKEGKVTVTVTATGTVDGKEVTQTDTVVITAVKLETVSTTIAELNAKVDPSNTSSTIWDNTTIYEVSGIIEGLAGDKYGNGYLTDPETGEMITIYGLSGVENNGFTYTDGKWTYSNPKDAQTSLTDVKNGQEVTLRVMFEDFKGKANICGSVISHEASTRTYVSTITVGENGDATLSSTEALAYGTTVTVTATPSDGYVVDAVKVKTAYGETTLSAAEDGTYSYNVTCKNEVSVTFKEQPVAPDGDTQTVTVTASDLEAVTNKAFSQTVGAITLDSSTGTINDTQIRIFKGQTLKISVSSGVITKAVFTCTANGTSQYGPGCFTGDDNYTAGTGDTGTWALDTGSASFTLTASSNQVRITSIEITYIAAK